MTALRDDTTRALRRTTLERQRRGRVPGVVAGVVRRGDLVWHTGVGVSHVEDPDTPPGPDDQFLVASNTKTFTAVLVMRLRDAGRLSLDDTLDAFIPEVPQRGLTIRQCLAHASGMQREPLGDVWETLVSPDRDQLVRDFAEAERVHLPHRYFHYSNLVYSMLGEVVTRLHQRPWYDVLRSEILDPLEMRRTTNGFDGPRVQGYFVPPYTDVPVPEPELEHRAMAPCGGLASTVQDLARWSAFVADPVSEVLAPDTFEEMCEPQVVVDRQRWTQAMGLGFFLVRSGTRTYVGHTGGMPGHITAVFTDREAKTGAIVLTSSGTTPDITGWALALADQVSDLEPVEPEPWRAGAAVPDDLAELVGRWWTEGAPFDFVVRQGRLEARAAGQAEHVPPAVFERVGADLLRTVSGRERGELLRVSRDGEGRVSQLNWATYLVTRDPLPFSRSAGRA